MKDLLRSSVLGGLWAIAGVAILAQPSITDCGDAAVAAETAPLGSRPRVRSSLFGESLVRFELKSGHKAFVLEPAKAKATSEKPWVWYAPTLLADREEDWESPGTRHAWIFGELLGSGIHVAGVDVGESYGSPKGRAIYDEFYDLMLRQYSYSAKPALLAISRGGLMAFNWAADHPDRIGCLGGIYPVCNLRSYPRIERLAEAYGMREDELRTQIDQHNPMARLEPLAGARVPLFLLHGDHDAVVPLESNSGELARRYQALGGSVQLVIVKGKGHEVVPEFWQAPPLIEFFRKNVLAR